MTPVIRVAVSVLAVLGFTTTACRNEPDPGGSEAEAADGFWLSEGYGMMLQIDRDSLRVWEVTAKSCIPAAAGERVLGAGSPTEPVFQSEAFGKLELRLGAGGSRRIHAGGAASETVINRIPSKLPVCSQPTPNTPESNFDVFATTWAEHYILFDEKKVDWPAVVAESRAKVTPTTTPQQLFQILREMIEPMNDAHTFILAEDLNERFGGFREGTGRFFEKGRDHFRTVEMPRITAVTNRYLSGPVRTWCNDQIQYAPIDDSTGYFRILSFSGYASGGFEPSLAALESALDTIMTDMAARQRLVIDVRLNLGGADPLGLAIAARLTPREYQAYSKEARADPVDRTKWTPGQPSTVRPSTRPSFHGEVVELIGPLTISAGETFTQALMGREPKVVRIGENTQGVFSDVLGRRLPNGWRFGLPNEVFRTAEGKTFDGPGIPPDLTVPVFPESELRSGRDGALERAIGRKR
jgi:hypothetical protein